MPDINAAVPQVIEKFSTALAKEEEVEDTPEAPTVVVITIISSIVVIIIISSSSSNTSIIAITITIIIIAPRQGGGGRGRTPLKLRRARSGYGQFLRVQVLNADLNFSVGQV